MVVPAIMRLDRECLQGWEEGVTISFDIFFWLCWVFLAA